MKIAICVLTIIILVLYRKICRLQNKLQSQMKNYQKIIDEQNKRIQAEVHEKERISITNKLQTVYANPLCVKQNTFPLLSDFIA